MDIRSQTFLEFCTHPDVVALIDDPRPAWIFSNEGTQFLWTNAAGAHVFGAQSMSGLLNQHLSKNGFAQRIIAEAARSQTKADFITKALHFFVGLQSLNLTCGLKKIFINRRNSAVLVVAEAVPDAAHVDPLTDFCDLLATEQTAALIFNTQGTVLASAGLDDRPDPSLTIGTETPFTDRFPDPFTEDLLEVNTVSYPALIAKCQSESRSFILAIIDCGIAPHEGTGAGTSATPAGPGTSERDHPATPLLIDPQNMRILPAQGNPALAAQPERVETARAAAPENTAGSGAPPAGNGNDNPGTAKNSNVQPDLSLQFEPASHPTQFVWQMNVQEQFTFLSPEFGRAMNVRTADIVGRTWQEARRVFGIDDSGIVARALQTQDTWSGLTIDWPVDQGRLLCPVDLAALPAFDRDGVFAGYRGFGVCHTDRTRPVQDRYASARSNQKPSGTVSDPAPGNPEAAGTYIDVDRPPERAADTDDSVSGADLGAKAGELETKSQNTRNSVRDLSGPQAEEAVPGSIQLARSDHNVVRIVTAPSRNPVPTEADNLSKPEKDAFRKIAEALGARLSEDVASTGEHASASADDPATIDPGDRKNRPANTPAGHVLTSMDEPIAGTIDPRILDRLPIGVAIVHLRDVLYCNDTMLELLGYEDIAELSNAGGLEAIFAEPEEWPDTEKETETDQSVCVRMKNGDLKRVDARLHTVPWRGGNGLMISLHDLTDRKPPTEAKTTQPLFEEISEDTVRVAELESILETATDGIIIMTADGIVQGVNRSAEALFGRNRDELIGEEFAACLAPESRRSTRDYISGLTQNGVASVLNDGREVIGLAEAGGMIPLFMTVGRINTEGDDIKLCAVLRDITQWKKAEEELTSASREAELASSQKSDFLAKISHEIRTPLNAIIGFSEVMMEERFGPIGNERYREYLLDIHNSGTHIMSLINDLLDLSKIEAGKLELTFEAVSINDIIRECVALMQPQANRDRIIIRASLPTSIPNVVADARSLRQIVLNLLSNAIKFNNPGGQVIVSTALEDSGELFLRVRDTGIGMNKKDLKLALEPFRQLHTSRLGGGTGLGLPLTKALAEANRALFSLASEAGDGTLVEITFPAQRVLVE